MKSTLRVVMYSIDERWTSCKVEGSAWTKLNSHNCVWRPVPYLIQIHWIISKMKHTAYRSSNFALILSIADCGTSRLVMLGSLHIFNIVLGFSFTCASKRELHFWWPRKEKLQNSPIGFAMFVSPHTITLKPLNGYSSNLRNLAKICFHFPILVVIEQY